MQRSKQTNIKFIGANGQISLGKENAGKMVSIETIEDNVWVIKVGQFMPEAQDWIYQDNGIQRLENAFKCAEKHKPQDNFDKLVRKLQNDDKN